MNELPTNIHTTRKAALLHGARLCEFELRKLRAEAMRADGNPYMQPYTIDPSPEAERIMLAAMEYAASAAILRELAAAEA